MKPKKGETNAEISSCSTGETNAEMDEPMKSPLQLVKELVLLVVEARTPDISVKGRVEGPHCPVIRGRLAHKCSSEKSECVRASQFCCLAQKLWLNSIPVCLDILLFPDCVHGREEASVTEGAVTKLSRENTLLVERWIIDGSKRRQDDCLSPSMLIQAVRSYLHFSQISSWLYSSGGKLPGLLAYRLYAPGEVMSLDFPQTPDIHSFPVCLANFHHVRVRISSLQRQASVPNLVCLQEQTMGNNSCETLCRKDSTRKQKSQEVKFKARHGQFKDCSLTEHLFMGNMCASGLSKNTVSSTAGYSAMTKKSKGSKKSLKSLQEVSAQVFLSEEKGSSYSSFTLTGDIPSTRFSRTDNTHSSYSEPDHRQFLSDADILAKKTKNLARMKTFDCGDGAQRSGDVLYATSICIDTDLESGDETEEKSLKLCESPASDVTMFTPNIFGRMKSSGPKTSQALLSKLLVQKTSLKNNLPILDISQEYDDKDCVKLDRERRVRSRTITDDRKSDLCVEHNKTSGNVYLEDRKQEELIRGEEYRETDQEVDVQTVIRRKKRAEYSKFKKSFIDGQPDLEANLQMWWPLQNEGMKELSQTLLGNSANCGNDWKKYPLSLSPPKKKLHDSNSNHSQDITTFNYSTGIESKMQARKKSKISQKEATEEELIRILSDRLSIVNTPQKEMFTPPKFSTKFHNTEAFIDSTTMLTNLAQRESNCKPKKNKSYSRESRDNIEYAGLEDAVKVVSAGFDEKYAFQDSKFSQLTINISRSPEDSDDTPIASPNQTTPPNQTTQLKSELFIKSVKDRSIEQNLTWLPTNLSMTSKDDAPLKLTESPNEFSILNHFRFVPCETSKELDDTALRTLQSLTTQTISTPDLHLPLAETLDDKIQLIQLTDQNNVFQPQKVLSQSDLDSITGSQNSGLKSDLSVCRTLFDNHESHLLNNEKCLKENSNVNEDPLYEEINLICDQDVPQPGSRRIFEENLLPLVSYDADSDSFRKVEELYSTNILHSPKVLFSCDVPSTAVTNSKKCIDFGDLFEAEFFKSKIGDAVGPEAIGKYMSNLAILSNLTTSGKEDQEEDILLDNTKHQEENLNKHDAPSNGIEILSRGDSLLQQTNEIKVTEDNADLQSIHNYCVIKTDEESSQVKKEQSKKRSHKNPDTTVEESIKKCFVDRDNCTKSRRQLNLSYFENTKPAHTTKIEEHAGLISLNSNIDLSSLLLDSTVHQQNILEREEHPKRKLPNINSKDISVLYPSERLVSLSPLLSSSCSSSSSSTSSVLLVSDSLSPTLPVVLRTSPASRQETFQGERSSGMGNCLLDIQNTLCTFSLNGTSGNSLLEQHDDDDSSKFPSGRQFNIPRKTQFDFKSYWASSSNTESQTFTVSDATFCVPSVSPSTTSPPSLNSFNISTYSLPSTVPLPLPIPHDATNNILCHNDNSSTTSLSQVILPQPSSQDEADLNYRSFFNVEPEHYNSRDLQHNCSDSLKDHRLPAHHDLDSWRNPATETPHPVPTLFEDESQATCQFDIEYASRYQTDRISTDRQEEKPALNISLDKTEPHGISSNAQTSLDTISRMNTTAAKSVEDNCQILSDITNPMSHHLQNKIPPTTTSVETNDNQSNCSYKDNYIVGPPTTSDTTTSDSSATTVQTTAVNGIYEPLSVTSDVSVDDGCSTNDISQLTDESKSSCNKRDLTETLKQATSKNGFEVKDEYTAQENDVFSDWSNDVVFYISESECKVKAEPAMSLLSSSLIEVATPSQSYKAMRPSSLSAEVNLEMRLRSNPGIGNKSKHDFPSHSRSPPFHNEIPGWNSVPPHRTVSTPSCMDRETKSEDETSSSHISVIQQQNCDNVSHTGLRRMAAKSASMIFNNRTGLPTQSSPAPLKRKPGGTFDYDVSLLNTRAIKNAFSCSKLASNANDGDDDSEEEKRRTLSTSAPASTNCLLGNFEESILNGRIDPVGTVDGFTAEIGASGSFCPKHLHLPVSAFFFALSDDNAPSPYLGHINLESVGKKGYHIPKKGTVQVTLFNPNKTVVKMFVVVFDLTDMPASSQTFIRQRTIYCPIDKKHTAPSYLRYLIHLRCASSQSGKIYLHTDIRLIFARHKLDIDAKTIPYELKSYTEGPQNPKYSPKK